MTDIDIAELDDLIANHEDVLLVDVREREGYLRGHIPGALAIPAGALEHALDVDSIASNPQLLAARKGTVVVYCDDGRRSRVAAAQLRRHGFSTVYALAGGLSRWRIEGFPIVTD